MKLYIISWNIRHFRQEKLDEYLPQIYEHAKDGHIVFIYEEKIKPITLNRSNTVADLREKIEDETMDVDILYESLAVPVGTNENVVVLYTKQSCPRESKKSKLWKKFGNSATFQIAVDRHDQWDKQLVTEAWTALKQSKNDTIATQIASQKLTKNSGYRIPAVVNITVSKPDGVVRQFKVAAWHAPGPAMGSPGVLFGAFANVLSGKVDFFLGDFNYNPQSPFSPPPSVGNIQNYALQQSTTITSKGKSTSHTAGPDLVYYDNTHVYTPSLPGTAQVGKLLLGSVTATMPGDAAKFYELTDHLPIVCEVKHI
jgi:hypothetical protein